MNAERDMTAMLVRDGPAQLSAFQALVADIPYERKGILFSEMFFFWLCSRTVRPRRILESGRARGQSTLVLSRCFPEAEILSVESDRNSQDVVAAAERLKGCANVRQLFGDATRLLPQMARPGDGALIDGPKGYRGLRLALGLLAGGKTSLVFMHDTTAGSEERRYLDKRMPEAFYSDLPAFAALAHGLDQSVEDDLPEAHRWTPAGAPSGGYGYSLACLPAQSGRGYRLLLAQAYFDGLAYKLFRTGKPSSGVA